jgi:hypothetical protein
LQPPNDIGRFTSGYESTLSNRRAHGASGSTAVDNATSSVTNSNIGTVPLLTVSRNDITSVQVSVTNDGDGFALYGGAGAPIPTPLPAAAWLLLSGLGGTGALIRRRSSV